MKKLIQKSIKLDEDIVKRIEEDAKNETRNFSRQLEHIIKKYYEIQDSLKK